MLEENESGDDWGYICQKYTLSEEEIERNSDKVCWYSISRYQKLSENFIEKHANKVNWDLIIRYQKLSEGFIEKNSSKMYWNYVFRYQKLSEAFIEKHINKMGWTEISLFISKYQQLSESFIEKYSDKVNWYGISEHQKLSHEFIKKHKLTIPETCWLYKDKEFKRKYIQSHTNYEIIGDKVIAYKTCRLDGYSAFNFQYKYEVGKEYEAHADHNIDHDNSFGLSAWTEEGALEYYPDGKLFKVEIDLDDIAAIVHNNKIRAKKIKILEEITV